MGTLQRAGAETRLRVTNDETSVDYDDAAAVGALRMVRADGAWSVVDGGVEGGVFHEGCRIGRLALRPGRPVRLAAGAPDGPTLLFEVLPVVPEPTPGDTVPAAVQPAAVRPATVRPASASAAVQTIGRGAGNTLVLDDPLVSRHHAAVDLTTPPVLRDLDSFNGTFVNGERVTAAELAKGDQVVVGAQTLEWDGRRLAPPRRTARRMLVADGLSTVTPDLVRLLDGVSLELEAGSLTAIIGPSGAGKTTLLNALTGLVPAGRGRVLWNGHDLYRHYEELRFQIGVVPQEEILHPQLTVRDALRYAARLRLPPDTTRAEQQRRVDQVVAQLGLDAQRDLRIGRQLSGGQRKRVSIATELLTAPPLLFLDEPTSGLDPGLDRSVTEQLRGLADDDRVVVVVTHSVLALDLCDQVVVLGKGGRALYVGPPEELLAHFEVRDYPALFQQLDSARPRPRSAGTTDTGSLPAVPRSVVPPQRPSRWRQLGTLVARDVAVARADRALMAMLVLLPLALAGLSRVVQGDAGFSLHLTREGRFLDGSEVTQRLTILVVAAALMGAAMTIRELVKERGILRREYAVGLSPGPYLMSKVIVLGGACFLQGLLLTWLATTGLPGPDRDGVHGWGWWEIALPVAALATAMAVVGLAASACLRSADHAMPVLVALVMVQLVLSGAIVGVAGRPLLEQVAWLAPSRWAYAASAASVHLGRTRRGVEDAVRDPLQAFDAGQWNTDLLAIVAIAALAAGLGLVAVRRSARSVR
ncbi:ATP-binding cassette domain-containing protein [Nocardioides stalactiti]|uniref:ATP-binding cassette domain-containing protein n=1 Tax=Nocardioides stalactiti TaxID=2755356 RepID=UPI0016032207|nr:ATP-binding cassette domain-containing protein [Nocardioides stalactiti]